MTIDDTRWSRLTVAMSVAAGLGLAWLLWLGFVGTFLVQWNAPRLAPAAALVRGLAIYGTADSGPFLGWVYGPVFPVVFGSVAWLPDQVSIHGAAWVLHLVIVVVPLWLAARCGGGRAAAAGSLVVGALLALATSAGRNALSFIHVDALCCGFSLIACVALARSPGSGRGLAVAAGATVLALGTKQVALGLVFGLVLWLSWSGRRTDLVRYLGWLAAGSVVAAVAAVAVFGFDELVFNLWTIHRHNPLPGKYVARLAGSLGALTLELLPAVLVWLIIRSPRVKGGNAVADRLERALAWVAFAHLPFGLLAAAKVAGGLNSMHTLYFASCLVVVRLARVFAMPDRLSRRAQVAVVLVTGLAWGQGWLGMRRDEVPHWPQVQALREVEEMARREQGRIYFPWNPLVTILTERVVRPFDDALLCLDRCGFPADRAAVLAGIPPRALVVYPDPAQSTFALKFMQGKRP